MTIISNQRSPARSDKEDEKSKPWKEEAADRKARAKILAEVERKRAEERRLTPEEVALAAERLEAARQRKEQVRAGEA